MLLFNYCTWSYSFATWSEQNWKEYLPYLKNKFKKYNYKGTVRPLLLPGMEMVWFKLLTEDYGYPVIDALKFIPGPAYTPWWLMGNLYSIGCPSSETWCNRQAKYGKWLWNQFKDAGWEPILPGWNGMVPADFSEKVTNAETVELGKWCGFDRPHMLKPNSDLYKEFAKNYYKRLEEVFGKLKGTQYYSIDLFHEGCKVPSGVNAGLAWKVTYKCLKEYNPDAIQVVQAWQWTDQQKKCLTNISVGKLLVMDMQSDVNPSFNDYRGHNAAFCVIPNFGGRTGVLGRVEACKKNYLAYKGKFVETGWIPEGIPDRIDDVNYTALNELISLESTGEYDHSEIKDILWDNVYKYLLNCSTTQQGPTEPLACCTIKGWSNTPPIYTYAGSTYGTTSPYYDNDKIIKNIFNLYYNHKSELSAIELKDLTTILLNSLFYKWDMQEVGSGAEKFAIWKKSPGIYVELLNKLQSLDLNTHYYKYLKDIKSFSKDPDEITWLFRNNILRLNTLWYNTYIANTGGLNKYAYREFGWLLKHIYQLTWTDIPDDTSTSENSVIEKIESFIENFDLSNYSDLGFTKKTDSEIRHEIDKIIKTAINKSTAIITSNKTLYDIELFTSVDENNPYKPSVFIPQEELIGDFEDKSISINTDDRETVQDHKQCLASLSVNSIDCDVTLNNLKSSSIIINPNLIGDNKTITVNWTGDRGIVYCAVTVALIGLRTGKVYYKELTGKECQQNSDLETGSKSIVIPNNASDKNFKLICKIDSAWAIYDFYHSTTRPVYEIYLITDSDATAIDSEIYNLIKEYKKYNRLSKNTIPSLFKLDKTILNKLYWFLTRPFKNNRQLILIIFLLYTTYCC